MGDGIVEQIGDRRFRVVAMDPAMGKSNCLRHWRPSLAFGDAAQAGPKLPRPDDDPVTPFGHRTIAFANEESYPTA